ncbi:hypothetical protein [Actinokineospora sp. NBRC 105648]|uniref:hypothetical protein n=1 Tax=Actinokineospora sp. NBRC 105648 TaxID=3032206 RepID=UPI0024A4E41E|nr:hypothetical protein [Actinokineospora sp. NBRC 105648]GLZ42682.1 hypothetical protein Acsp05_63060 [Actinokineospora sp. NBRC 105648]
MSWDDFYRRRDALDAALAHLRHNPEGSLPLDEVADVFDSATALLLALHYRWTLKLAGRVGLAQATAEKDPSVDLVDAVAQAWRTTATEHPVLRRVLDAHPETVRPAEEGEYRMLALAANLAEYGDSRDELTRVGAAFVALLRSAPPRAARRRTPVDLLRRLVASA